jgi:hypothetical protein
VDRYRPGHKTILLISLRETKRRNDVDEFNISWKLKDSFVREHELWETEILHKTKQLKVKIIFPASRLPRRAWIEEHLRRRRRLLGPESIHSLHDGRWQLSWRSDNPRLNERYQVHWEW